MSMCTTMLAVALLTWITYTDHITFSCGRSTFSHISLWQKCISTPI